MSSTPHQEDRALDHGTHDAASPQPDETGEEPMAEHGGWKHWGLMLLCCLPMVAIALVIVFGLWT